MVQLDVELERGDLIDQPETVEWFNQSIRYLTPDLASTLSGLPERILAKAEQERQLQAKQAALRERQLAVKLAQELETTRQQEWERQQRALAATTQQAEQLLAKAERLAHRGAFNDALDVITEIQAIDPPQIAQVMITRGEIVAAKAQVAHDAQMEELERMFTRAMKIFEQGDYEEAIAMFEHVIQAEAGLAESPHQMAGSDS